VPPLLARGRSLRWSITTSAHPSLHHSLGHDKYTPALHLIQLPSNLCTQPIPPCGFVSFAATMSGADILDSATPGPTDVPSSDGLPASGTPAFVAPRTYLDQNRPVLSHVPLSPVDREQMEGLKTIRAFLKVRTSYDVLPLSFRLIVLDTSLLVKKSLNILIQNGGVTSPCSQEGRMLTFGCRHCLSAAMGLKNVNLCGATHHLRLHQCYPILLAESRCSKSGRSVSLE
jgi:hypothetical protein